MPVAREGMFSSYVTNREGKDLLYIAAGGLGLYIDINSMEVTEKVRRKLSKVEEFAPTEGHNLRTVSYEPEEYQDWYDI